MAKKRIDVKDLDSWTYLDLGIFRNTKLTVFEALVKFLKDEKGLSFKEISLLLGKDERNIWTVYNRGKSKL